MSSVLTFIGFEVESVDYKLVEAKDINEAEDLNEDINSILKRIEAGSVKVDVSAEVNHYEKKSTIQLNLRTLDIVDEKLRRIDLDILGYFEVQSDELDDYDITREELLKVNGTAILMPYIRSYLSSLTGFDTKNNHLLLPTINVQTLFEE